jgi:hypothetical protein
LPVCQIEVTERQSTWPFFQNIAISLAVLLG